MKWFSKAAVGGLLWLAFSAGAFGDTLNFTGYPNNVDDGGQFSATLSSDPGQTLLVYCVDYANFLQTGLDVNISTPNPSVSPDAGLANTRYGQTPEADFSFFNSGSGTLSSGTAPLSALQRYVLAAWLTQQYVFPIVSGPTTVTDDQIQNAIWSLLSVNGTSGFPFGDAAGTGNFLTLAEQWLGGESAPNLAAFESEIRIYTSTNTVPYTGASDGLGSSFVSGSQEMIGVMSPAPEPATLAMLGAGLVAFGLFRKRINLQ
jgi:hypothetical protein